MSVRVFIPCDSAALAVGADEVAHALQSHAAARGMVAIDRFGAFFKYLFLLAAALTILMSPRYLDIEGARPGTYYFLLLCATLGMMFMAPARARFRSSLMVRLPPLPVSPIWRPRLFRSALAKSRNAPPSRWRRVSVMGRTLMAWWSPG
jgi:hypothetical protein